MNTKEKLKNRLLSEIESAQRNLDALEQVEGLEELELDASFYGNQIDFDNISHENVIKVMRALKAGKWDKVPAENAAVHYTAKVAGINIRCWNGAPPPNCKIVEYLEDVPEQIIPAKTVTKRKLVCQ